LLCPLSYRGENRPPQATRADAPHASSRPTMSISADNTAVKRRLWSIPPDRGTPVSLKKADAPFFRIRAACGQSGALRPRVLRANLAVGCASARKPGDTASHDFSVVDMIGTGCSRRKQEEPDCRSARPAVCALECRTYDAEKRGSGQATGSEPMKPSDLSSRGALRRFGELSGSRPDGSLTGRVGFRDSDRSDSAINPRASKRPQDRLGRSPKPLPQLRGA
jgi:hypothetical protein